MCTWLVCVVSSAEEGGACACVVSSSRLRVGIILRRGASHPVRSVSDCASCCIAFVLSRVRAFGIVLGMFTSTLSDTRRPQVPLLDASGSNMGMFSVLFLASFLHNPYLLLFFHFFIRAMTYPSRRPFASARLSYASRRGATIPFPPFGGTVPFATCCSSLSRHVHSAMLRCFM